MWKRDESVKPTTPQPPAPAVPAAAPPAPAAAVKTPPTSQPTSNDVRGSQIERDKVNIGKSVVIKGELSGSEDLTIEGHVEGKIELRENVLTIGPNGKISAEVFAKAVIVLGEVTGNVTASEKVDIRDNGSVDGDIISPRVAIAEGAHFRGSVDMQRAGTAKPGSVATPAKPGQTTTPAQTPTPAPGTTGQATGQKVGA
jgi:cytoskeletal protein CcmA (bactofilin family)